MKFYSNLKGEEKKKIRDLLLQYIDNRKKQIELMKKFLEPYERGMNGAKAVLKNEMSFEQFSKINKETSKFTKKMGELMEENDGQGCSNR